MSVIGVNMKNINLVALLLIIQMNTFPKFDADYRNCSSMQYSIGKKALESFGLKGTERVLDIGCGTGKTTADCAKKLKSGSVHGFDISQDMINFAKKEYKEIPNLSFEQRDVVAWRTKKKYDFAYSILCLHWVPDQPKALRKIAKSLKPGSKCMLYISSPSSTTKAWDKSRELMAQKYPQWAKHLKNNHDIQPAEKWLTWSAKAGFTIVNHKVVDYIKKFPTMDGLKEFTKSLGIASELPSKEREEFFKVLLTEFSNVIGRRQDDPYIFNHPFIVLELQKPIK